MTPNDERAQIRATGATSAHVGMTEAEQERARVVHLETALREIFDAFPASGSFRIERMRSIALDALLSRDHLKGVE